MEIVAAEKPDAEKPYMMWRRSLDKAFGEEDYMLPVYGGKIKKKEQES